jgi:hypothetical protein
MGLMDVGRLRVPGAACGKSIALLAAVVEASYVAIMIAIDKSMPEGTAAMLRFFGEAVGDAIPSFVLGLIVLLIVRFLRRRSGAPFAGLLSGAIVTLAASYSQYIGELPAPRRRRFLTGTGSLGRHRLLWWSV